MSHTWQVEEDLRREQETLLRGRLPGVEDTGGERDSGDWRERNT